MASFYAELRVAGYVFRIWHCTYGSTQDTDARSRATAKVRQTLAEFVLDVPDHDFLEGWASDPLKRLAAEAVFSDATGQTLETLSFAAAYCVGYQEFFSSGDTEGGSYQCRVTLSDPDGWHWQPGGPAPSPQAFEQNPFVLPQTPVVPPVPVPPVEVPVPPAPLGLLARLLALLPELGVAAAVAVLVPTNSRDDPGYQSEWDFIRRNTPPTDKDRAELADLERRHADGTLTADEEAHLLALLARVKGLRLASLSDAGFNEEWDRTAPPELAQLDLQSTLNHVESRDYSVPRKRGIGGTHNAAEWAKYNNEYVEVTRTAHPSVPGVYNINYQIFALDPKGKPTGGLVAEVFPKTIYDPQIWPRPRLERALKEAVQNAHTTHNGVLSSPWWEGTTREGYVIRGTNRNGKIETFFFK
ncbi:type VI secretion system tube protein TssD [Hymenobacter terrenus]|uniref:type VI secretion system tube protein TssD n=1 Tax=Hymenobacter terrenus TaxID=1629124 RepID=UPI000699138E|nr:type VI secretion system tube protein TssD [Hymenobacter terrenus]